MLVHVHPKYISYIVSDDPLDYYFGEYTGIEITTGTGGNMAYEENEKAYFDAMTPRDQYGNKEPVATCDGVDREILYPYWNLIGMFTESSVRISFVHWLNVSFLSLMASLNALNFLPAVATAQQKSTSPDMLVTRYIRGV